MNMQTPFDRYGVECGEGWRTLYEPILDLARLYGLRVLQVKEKFGLLRIYVEGDGVNKLTPLIDAVERASIRVCERCGADGTRGGVGWIKTLCEPCRTANNNS